MSLNERLVKLIGHMVTMDISEVDSERRIVEGEIVWVDTDYVETEICEEDEDVVGNKTQIIRIKNVVSIIHSINCNHSDCLPSTLENNE
jgi:hypothetical protein